MIAARVGACLAIVAFASNALAADHIAAPSAVDDTPILSLDCGGGVVQPNYSNSTFQTLDTWNGQHTLYGVTGSSLGMRRPLGWILNATGHLFPFSFRAIGLVATAEFGGFTTSGSASSPFGAVDLSSNGYWSVLAGPEAQLRAGGFLLRAAVLGGGRYASVGDFSATEWRIAARTQVDYIVGDARRGGSAFTLGLFGAFDVFPQPGWSSGVSMSFAAL